MEHIIEFINDYKFNGILNIEYRNKKYLKKMGYRNIKKNKITKNTIFPIGSLSKIFYGFAIIMLLDKSLIKSLDDKVYKYIPYFKKKKIKIIDCLLHISGITEIRSNKFFNKNVSYSSDEFIKLIDELNLYIDNNYGKYMYSSANYFIIGKIIDILTGSSNKFLKTIFNNLKLKNTLFIDDVNNSLNFADGFDINKKIFKAPPYRKKNFYGGDICSTYQDFNTFMKNRHKLIKNNKNIKLLTKDFNITIDDYSKIGSTLIKNQKIIIGCRLITINNIQYIVMAGHFPGYHVSSVYSLDYNIIINTFSNIDKTGHSIEHMDELSKNFLIVLVTKYRFYSKPSLIKNIKNINKYIGTYSNEYTYYKIYLKEDKLRLYSRKQDNELYYLGYNKFYRNPYSYIKIMNNILYVFYYTGIVYQLKKTAF